MNRHEALTELLAIAQAGDEIDSENETVLVAAFGAGGQAYLVYRIIGIPLHAMSAAWELHEAVVPGCHFDVANEASGDGYVAEVFDPVSDGTIGHGHAQDPARAWLIAILKVLVNAEVPA